MSGPVVDRRQFIGGGTSVLSALMPLALSTRGAFAAMRELRASDIGDVDYPTVQALFSIDRELRRDARVEMRLRVFANGQLGDEREIIQQLRIGVIDIARISVSALADHASGIGVLAMPYLFKSSAHLHRVIDGEIGRRMLESLEDFGFIGLTFLDAGSRCIYNRERPIVKASDVVGLRLCGEQSNLSDTTLNAMGATPMQLPFNQVLPALNAGLADGAIQNLAVYAGAGHLAAAPYLTISAHDYSPDVIVISRKAWAGLHLEEQSALRRAAANARPFLRGILDRWLRLSLSQAHAQGIKIVEQPDITSFQAAFRKLVSEIESGPGSNWLREVQAAA